MQLNEGMETQTTSVKTTQGTTLETTVQTVEAFLRTQVVVPQWMHEALEGLADDAEVRVVREHAGFLGTFVRSVEAV